MQGKRRLRGYSPGVRHAGEERHLAIERGPLHRHDEGKHACGALRLGKSTLTRRADPHMRVDSRNFVGFEGTQDVTGDQVVDMPDVIRG
jgi:hypothetical protein